MDQRLIRDFRRMGINRAIRFWPAGIVGLRATKHNLREVPCGLLAATLRRLACRVTGSLV